MPEDREFLFQLLDASSPVGREVAVQRLWVDRLQGVADAVDHDAYGNAWATIAGSGGPTLLLEAHVDEIGLAVRHVTDEGLIHVVPLGGSDPAVARAKRVRILLDDGSSVDGVVGNTAIHLRDRTEGDKVPKWHEITVDIGASSKDEVFGRGVHVGSPIVYRDGPEALGEHRVVARAIDNRVSGYILARVAEELKAGPQAAATVQLLNAVHEEIGGFGATIATYRLKPQVAVCIDVTHATDTPGIEAAQYGKVTLGGGPTVTHGTINHPVVVAGLSVAAKDAAIELQHESISSSSGTDTDNIFTTREGVPAALLSIPLRYMHSPVETVDMRDVEACVQILVRYARSLGPDSSFSVL
ncbi:MAG: M20/M25/M40 family metallo-hydrolase [Planctomycetota bacterium]|nr:M20/M25/M40 family metallo-hydrolase [Planctomycetota bacterium]